jgi:sec-independent protein translocase protein TatA
VAYNRAEMPIHPFWIAAILIIVLIVFGPSRLPELGSAVGKSLREFRKATSELTNEVKATATAEPKPEAPKVDSTATSSSEPRASSNS